MLFNSWVFLIFFGVVTTAYYALSHKGQNRMLLAASYLFYGWWDWRFLLLLILSSLVDFFTAQLIEREERPGRRRFYLGISVGVGLTILGFFKYFNFFVGSLSAVFAQLGLHFPDVAMRIVLPVGISFYTFQTMSYTIDVYRRLLPAERSMTNYFLFVTYFPQLVAGPIVRAGDLLPALKAKRTVGRAQVYDGLQLMLVGFVKKIAIADAVAPYADRVFDSVATASAVDLWLGVYLFALQIYADFSGYSDIARGISKLYGIDLMVNFRQPYLSASVTEFWRRWHISLSTWLRDYLYIPLGGNRGGELRTYANLMTTMLLGGLWHGANWTYVAWGFLNGLYLSVEKLLFRVTGMAVDTASGWLRPIRVLVTFHLICVTWIFFRCPDFSSAALYFQRMVTIGGPATVEGIRLTTLFYGLVWAAIDLPLFRGNREILMTSRVPWAIRGVVYAALFLLLSFVGEFHAKAFIYFQF